MTTTAGSRPLGAERHAGARHRPTPDGRLTRLEDELAARFSVPPLAVVGCLFLCAVVVIVLGARLLAAQHTSDLRPVTPRALASADAGPAMSTEGSASAIRPRATSPPARPTADSATGGRGMSTAGTAADSSAAGMLPSAAVTGRAESATAGDAGGGVVVVYVVGRVRHPGVVRLPSGARLEQALQAVGGPRGDADLTRVNLARRVVDGEQVIVPRPGEPVDPAPVAVEGIPSSDVAEPGGSGEDSSSGAVVGSGAGSGVATGPRSQVDINTASVSELDALPGVGPVLARRILDWRAQNGRFTTVEELGEVSGIGDRVLARLRPFVRL